MNPPETRQQICGVVLLRADDAALLQLRDNKPEISDPGLWVFPGGHCERDEHCRACAAREFLEETRYRCTDLRHLVAYNAADLGYGGDFRLHFYWDRFDGIQDYHCCEGQQLRFIGREQASFLRAPPYLLSVWDLALAARRAWQESPGRSS